MNKQERDRRIMERDGVMLEPSPLTIARMRVEELEEALRRIILLTDEARSIETSTRRANALAREMLDAPQQPTDAPQGVCQECGSQGHDALCSQYATEAAP